MPIKKMRERGYVVVTVALLLAILLGFAALAVDVGMLYSARTSAQKAADAAALAGAYTFVIMPFASQPGAAEAHARGTALANSILADPIQDGDVTVNVDTANRRVTVGITQPHGTYFGRALGWDSTNIAVRAVAEASKNAEGATCVKPWFIPNTVLSASSPCDAAGACATGNVIIRADGTLNEPLLEANESKQVTIKPSNPQNALTPGEFYCIRIGDSTGGNDYRTNIATCSPEAIQCQKLYSVEPGNMIGPTAQGAKDLIGSPPDIWISRYVYEHPDGTRGPTSRSLVLAPIWNICALSAYCNKQGKFVLPESGANIKIPVVGFALIFIDGVQANDVLARIVTVFTCGGAPAPENPDVTGPYSIPLRLVRVPQAED